MPCSCKIYSLWLLFLWVSPIVALHNHKNDGRCYYINKYHYIKQHLLLRGGQQEQQQEDKKAPSSLVEKKPPSPKSSTATTTNTRPPSSLFSRRNHYQNKNAWVRYQLGTSGHSSILVQQPSDDNKNNISLWSTFMDAAFSGSPVKSKRRASPSSLASHRAGASHGSSHTPAKASTTTRTTTTLPASSSPTTTTTTTQSPESATDVSSLSTSTPTVPSTTPLTKQTSNNNHKWKDLQGRVTAATAMVVAMTAFATIFREDGLIFLVFFLQGGLYHEVLQTLLVTTEYSAVRTWWYFGLFVLHCNGHKLIPWQSTTIEGIVYALLVATLIGQIVAWNNTSFSSKIPMNALFAAWTQEASASLLALFLSALPASYWLLILEDYGMAVLWMTVALVTVNDIGAYLCGKALGKHKWLPSISPNKTWEGYFGAGVLTVATAALLQAILTDKTGTWLWPVAFFVATVAPLGGALASVVKRACGKKDFGSLLGNHHGGLVDRLDCHLFTAPALYFFLQVFGASLSADVPPLDLIV